MNVGNEVLIEWTDHPVREDQVIRYVREVKAGATQPVTVADNYVWWRDHGAALAREVDFITIHTYPLWERKDIDELPVSETCFFNVVFPVYPDKETFKQKLTWAVHEQSITF